MRLLALTRKELLLLRRDPHALAVLFLLPTVLMVLMAFAMAGINRDQPSTLTVALDVAGTGTAMDEATGDATAFFAAALRANLGEGGLLTSATAVDAASGLPRVRLSPDFAATLLDPEASTLTLIFPALADMPLRQRLRAAVDLALAQTRLMAWLIDTGELDSALPLAERLAVVQNRTQSRVAVLEQRADGALAPAINSSQHSVPAWLIFGMFFITLPMATAFQHEQQSGTLMRFRALGLGLGTLALSKLLPYLAINLLQFALLLAIGALGLPLLGLPGLTAAGDVLAWLLLAVSVATAACGLGLAVAGVVRSTEQALLIGGGLNILLAAVGGIMVPKSVMPVAMVQLAEVSPMSWAHDAFLALLVGPGTSAAIFPLCIRLLLFALVAGGLGLHFFRQRLNDTQWTTQN